LAVSDILSKAVLKPALEYAAYFLFHYTAESKEK